jgi:hypothetical protein
MVSARRCLRTAVLSLVGRATIGTYPAAHRLRSTNVHSTGTQSIVHAPDCRKRAARHIRSLPERPQSVSADRSDRLRRRCRQSRPSGVWRDAVRRIGRGAPGVYPDSRLVPRGSALAGSESHHAPRSTVGDHDFSRRPIRLVRGLTERASEIGRDKSPGFTGCGATHQRLATSGLADL